MKQFQAIPKKWGNSLGITIPAEVVEDEHIQAERKITVLVMSDQKKKLKEIFGTLERKKPTQQMMDEIDEGYD